MTWVLTLVAVGCGDDSGDVSAGESSTGGESSGCVNTCTDETGDPAASTGSGRSGSESSGVLPEGSTGSSSSGDTDGGGSESTGGTTGASDVICDRDHAGDLEVVPLLASQTDPEITDVFNHRYVEADGVPAERLFVFIPGTGGPPAGYQRILQHAAAGGYHALGLAYPNAIAINDVCIVADAGCHEAARHEVLTGEDTSPHVDVSPVNSIEHRLVAALQHLGWEQYLDGGQPAWERIAFAGHSQGAGHAGFIAREHAVYRSVLFAGTEPADWTESTLATDVERLFGFVHVEEDSAFGIQNSWANLGIPGEPFDVDGRASPFGESHRLTTALEDDGGNPHGSVVTDPYTPLDEDGLPVYRDVWCALIGP